MTTPASDAFVRAMPKVELHLHIEGTLEPETLFALAERNRVALPWSDLEALRAAYAFTDLQSFLDVYYRGADVLRTAEDFHDLAWAWCRRAAADHTRHAEVFFDPQTHTDRGIALATVIEGLSAAFARAERELGLHVAMIPCFLRHLDEAAAMATFVAAEPWLDRFVAFGLDSSERGNPPEKFAAVFAAVRAEGLRVVAHAGEEGPPAYIRGALDRLGASRIDHGVRCLEDEALVARLVREQIPLTVCPLSNVRLRVFDRIEDHNLRELLARGLCVTINSDDPAYFGGYLGDNYVAVTRTFALDRDAVRRLAEHAITAAFVDDARRSALRTELAAYFAASADPDANAPR